LALGVQKTSIDECDAVEYRVSFPDSAAVVLAQMGDSGAVEHLLYKYRNVVKSGVRRLFIRGAERDDLLQVGMIALWEAVVDYSPDKKLSFLSFAKTCIERNMLSAVTAACRRKHDALSGALSLDPYADEDGDNWYVLSKLATSEDDPAERLLNKECALDIERWLKTTLSKFEWEVLSRHRNGNSYCEIATDLDCNTKSVDNALQRIKRALDRHLTQIQSAI
jgi:RNA polymerase sporulation-specific sigma factor